MGHPYIVLAHDHGNELPKDPEGIEHGQGKKDLEIEIKLFESECPRKWGDKGR